MFTMFDLFRQAQGGAAFDNLARAYGMSPEQMRATAAALTPAFMQGFQRQAASDAGAQRFAELFQTETYARAFEAQAAALDPANRPAGEDALGALFGNKEVSRAVAAQAAAASGVQAQIIRQVLPVLASILMGGFMKAMQGGSAAQPGGGFPGPFGDVFGQMFGQGGRGRTDHREAAPGNPFEQWMNMFGRGTREAPQQQQPSNPMGEAMGDILNSMFGGAPKSPQQSAPQQPAPDPAPNNERPAEAGDETRQAEPADPFDEMFRTGREISAQNAEAMERIFDVFFGGQTPKR
ncbi:DUF937 domain-containing protein [Chelatococcus sambhunathii]|uniref:DUF937 domain-containing protein n=1 Tax=Chelatococcus sambhunathii TaxID=363953 RepID=A0ABU1DK50_9HYPH|nr:DUF937 domain-containing protein [Chelatococcus sambhunathii]MDR4308502.1 DUF937 domain-containing protein [Chelatococcus sambhunathii]